MKQHLLGEQLKEVSFGDLITLLSLVLGLQKEYLEEEYEKGKKEEAGMLRAYGYQVNVGELLELVQVYTGQFPIPTIDAETYVVKVNYKNQDGSQVVAESDFQPSYCDALYEIVKKLLKDKVIS
jgi:hypothetical protein